MPMAEGSLVKVGKARGQRLLFIAQAVLLYCDISWAGSRTEASENRVPLSLKASKTQQVTRKGTVKGECTKRQIAEFKACIADNPQLYENMTVAAEAVGYDLETIGVPGSVPPRAHFSQTLHTLIGAYTNAVHAWLRRCELKKLLSRRKTYQVPSFRSEAQADLDCFLESYDPLLKLSLAHLLRVALGEDGVSQEERDYISLRMRWIEEVLLPDAVGIHWHALYEQFYLGLGTGIGIMSQGLQTAKTKAELKHVLKSHQPYARSSKLALRYLEAKDNPQSLGMTTVWNALVALMESGVKPASTDPLLFQHACFVVLLLHRYSDLAEEKRVLGLAWLEKVVIDVGAKDWREDMYGYQLPPPFNSEAEWSGESLGSPTWSETESPFLQLDTTFRPISPHSDNSDKQEMQLTANENGRCIATIKVDSLVSERPAPDEVVFIQVKREEIWKNPLRSPDTFRLVVLEPDSRGRIDPRVVKFPGSGYQPRHMASSSRVSFVQSFVSGKQP